MLLPPWEYKKRLERVEDWNAWRQENPYVQPDLRCLNLSGIDLSRADLSSAYLLETNLSKANLNGTCLGYANLIDVDLSGANLSSADLTLASLRGVDLSEASLNELMMGYTTLSRIDLRTTKELVTITHVGPSSVDLFTIQLPQNGSALHFLRGAGVPDTWIALYQAELMHPIQYYSLFISYSSKDETLAHRLHADLQAQGVRCWFAPEDLKIGTKFRQRIDEAIHLQDKLLLLLSEHCIASTWVENEVEAALEKEDRQQREVLFPVRLDDVVMQTSQAWQRRCAGRGYRRLYELDGPAGVPERV